MEADRSFLQRQTITDHLMKVVVVVAVFPVFLPLFPSLWVLFSVKAWRKINTYVKINGESKKMGPERLWGQEM